MLFSISSPRSYPKKLYSRIVNFTIGTVSTLLLYTTNSANCCKLSECFENPVGQPDQMLGGWLEAMTCSPKLLRATQRVTGVKVACRRHTLSTGVRRCSGQQPSGFPFRARIASKEGELADKGLPGLRKQCVTNKSLASCKRANGGNTGAVSAPLKGIRVRCRAVRSRPLLQGGRVCCGSDVCLLTD